MSSNRKPGFWLFAAMVVIIILLLNGCADGPGSSGGGVSRNKTDIRATVAVRQTVRASKLLRTPMPTQRAMQIMTTPVVREENIIIPVPPCERRAIEQLLGRKVVWQDPETGEIIRAAEGSRQPCK